MKRMFRWMLLTVLLAGTAGIAAAQDYRNYDDDDYRYDNGYDSRDSYRYDNFRRGIHVARRIGFRDGANVAREDMWRGKPFNPNPRGRYDDADRGYRHQYGHKREYREAYSEAYRDGYMRTFRGYGSYGY